jgi:nucleotide-binding universal stress UspA family protein
VRDVQAQLEASGVPFEFTQPVGVDAAAELLTAMDRSEAELLVIGIKHRSPVGKLLLGGTSQRLLLECPKPVLAVKPDED